MPASVRPSPSFYPMRCDISIPLYTHTLHTHTHIPFPLHEQNVTLTLVEVRESRCPVGTLCPLAGKATAVIEIGPGKISV